MIMVSLTSLSPVLAVVLCFTLSHCLVDVTEYCKSSPCQNGGRCEERVNGYVCECPGNYTGLHCSIFEYCSSAPCLHGGRCKNTINSFTCDCTGTGQDGDTCGIPHDDCQPNPCLHGGTCVDGVMSYTCQCLTGFTGSLCETEVSACLSFPCLNGGTCIDIRSGSNPGQTTPDFQCQCVQGFSGQLCETNHDDCAVNDCQHGTCVDGINSYTCDCSGSGYSGVHCEHKNVNRCLQNPCVNNGTCVQDGDDYHCECLPFTQGHITHGGKNCSVLLKGCQSHQTDCKNGGICIPVLLNEAQSIHDFMCSCQDGYDGPRCDSLSSMTLNPGSYVRKIYTSDYTLKLQFRTNGDNGVLVYDRAGQGFVSVELLNGSLYLVEGDSSGISQSFSVVITGNLSDSRWHSLILSVGRNTTLTLNDPQCSSVKDCTLSLQRPDLNGGFREFFIGQITVPSWRQQTMSAANFVGCIRNVFFNTEALEPNNFGIAEFHKITMDCPACLPNACNGIGQCRPSSTTVFECFCAYPLINGRCPLYKGISCDFDTGICDWKQDVSSQIPWTRYRGSTSSSGTGPTSDHTTGRGYYIYTEASGHYGKVTRLNSKHFDVTSTTCMSVWINMYGSSIGSLKIYQVNGASKTTLISRSGALPRSGWSQRKAQLHVAHNTYLQIEAITGTTFASDIAVDDIQLFAGSC